MKKNIIQRELFKPDKIPLLGSLGILALGDIGFEAWRNVKKNSNNGEFDEKE